MSPDSKKTGPSFGQNLSSLALFLVELVLPALVSAGIIAWLFTYYRVWAWGEVLGLVLFVLAVALLSFMVTVGLDTLTAGWRSAHKVVVSGPRARLLKFALGGLLLPIAAAIAINLIAMPSGGTLLSNFVALVKPPVQVTPPDEVARAVQSAEDPAVKRTGIEVLARFQSPEALNQLLRLAREDEAALRDAPTSRALSQAVAGYGIEARDPLLALFNSVDPAEAGGSLPDDLYGRYFDAAFAGLQAEVQSMSPEQSARVDAARAGLKAALEDLQSASSASAQGNPRPLFVLQTFQAMGISQEPDVLAFALKVAADPRFSSAVRAEALLLVGKLGGQNELPGLYAYLNNPDPLLQTRALQAVSAILSKGAPPPK